MPLTEDIYMVKFCGIRVKIKLACCFYCFSCSPKVRGIAGHIEQAERGAIRKSPQAHKHFCPLLPTAMVFVSYGFVLVQVQVQVAASPLTEVE